MFDKRVFHIIKKEFIQLFRDKRMIGVVLVAPIIQLLVFGYVATTDVKDIPTAVFDSDRTYVSRDFISGFKNSGYFKIERQISDFKSEKNLLDSGKVKLAINIPTDFSRNIKSGRTAPVQFIIDGTNSNSAGISAGYINGIVFEQSLKLLKDRYKAVKDIDKKLNIIDARVRVFHNQELKSVNYMVPGIIAQLLMMLTSILTAVSVVKEKEYGTMEQLIVSPIRPWELMLGKMVPYICLAFLDVLLVVAVAVFWFKVPLLGSLLLLLVLSAVFLMTSLGIGLFISTISATMQQTVLSIIFIMLPSMLLSGFIFPIANMPVVIQWFTYLIPLRYFLVIVRGIFLKGIGIKYLWKETLILLILGCAIFIMAVKRFRKKLE